MKFFPFENISYTTKLKEAELLNRLSDFIEPEKTFRFGIFGSGATKAYQGEINNSSFKISRIISYKNSFLPVITGVIQPDFDGARINVKMRLHVFVIVFIFIWSSGVAVGCLAVLAPLIVDGEFHPATFIPFGMLLFMYLLTLFAFKYESKKSKKDLQELFEGEMEEQ